MGAANHSLDAGDFKTYIRFDLSAESDLVQNVNLSLTLSSAYGFGPSPLNYTVYTMGDALGDDWNEFGLGWISYDTAPGNNPADYANMTGSTNLGSFSYDPLTAIAGDTLSLMFPALDDFLNNSAGDWQACNLDHSRKSVSN